jgi:hypothetical protein
MEEHDNDNEKQEKPICEISCFISSPFSGRFGKTHKILGEKVTKLVEEITRENIQFRQIFRITWNRLDNAPFIAQNIQKNVLSSIKNSHLLVADITPQFIKIQKKSSGLEEMSESKLGNPTKPSKPTKEIKSPNPSVMHEIGFATALGIPIFLIGEKGTSKNLPANLKGFLVAEYPKKVRVSLQDSVKAEAEEDMFSAQLAENITNSIHNASDSLALREKEGDIFSSNLAETITNVIKNAGAPLTPGEFVVSGYRLRRAVDLPYLIRNSKYRVYILTTNIEYVTERLLDPIKYALDFNTTLQSGSQEPLNKSYKVDILTMDPESIVTNARAKQLSANVAKFRDILRYSLGTMVEFANTYSDNIEIATYVSLPTLILFVIDDIIVFSVPFPSQQSRLVPHFVISHDDVTIQQFISYFFSVKSQAGREILL